MPNYNYKCNVCNEEHEQFHSITKNLNEYYEGKFKCANCDAGAEDQEILIHATPSIFKGSGWASDGYSAKTGNSLPVIGKK